MTANIEIKTNKPDYESVSTGLRAWINQAKGTKREYLVVLDSQGNKFYMNKVVQKEAAK